MCIAEMIVLMHRHRLLRDDTGPDPAGPGKVFGPVGPKIQPGSAQIIDKKIIPEEIDTDPFGIGQKQDVALSCDLPEQALQAAAGRTDQPFGLLAMVTKFRLGHDIGRITARGIHTVKFDTAPPRLGYECITSCGCAAQHPFDFFDVLTFCHAACPPCGQG